LLAEEAWTAIVMKPLMDFLNIENAHNLLYIIEGMDECTVVAIA
jgi:hypothetical protein